MKTLSESLARLKAKERLAVIADITSIAGVSLAAVTTSLFALTARKKLDVNNLLGVTIVSLIGLALFCCFIAGFIWVLTAISSKPWGTPSGIQFLAKCVAWLIFICGVLVAGITFYEFISGFRVFI